MVRFVALILTTLTGFTGLVYEVLWQRYLATLLGSHSEATAAVLGIFLGGLACGYALFGLVTRIIVQRAERAGSAPRVLFFYGIVEAAIGVYAFAFPLLFSAARAISLAIPHSLEGTAFAIDVVMTALLIGPPTILMGGTIPLLTQGLATGMADATRFHALVYATNTLGAFLGAVVGGFFLLPWLGLTAGVVAMGAINLAAGLIFIALGSAKRGATARVWTEGASLPAASHRLGAYALVALLGGFAMMALQTTMNRIGALAFGASHFTFATVVAAFVLCTALGSLAVSLASRIPSSVLLAVQWSLVAYLVVLYRGVGDAPYWAHVLRTVFRDHPAGFYPYYLAILGSLLLVAFIPLALSGATLPLLFHHLRRDVDDLGAIAGRLYSWNTVGSLLGALVGGYLLLFWLDLHHVYRLAVAALAAGAAVLSLKILARPAALAAGGLLLSLAALWLLPPWSVERLSSGIFQIREPTAISYLGPDRYFEAYAERPDATTCTFYDDDPVASVAVVQSRAVGNEHDRSIIVNGKSDGSIVGDDLTMRLLALIPAILAGTPERAFIVGYGTGVTAGELAAAPDVREITVAEIAPAVIAAAPHFEPFNGGVLENPKITIVRSDAYRALLRDERTFDVIISEPSNPWVMGVEMLFAEEFLRAARQRLRPGGVYAQWFHTYSINESTLALVFNTYRQVFPQSSVWFTAKNDIILLGFAEEDRSGDLERIAARWSSEAVRRRFTSIGIDSLPALLAHELLPSGVLAAVELPDAVHTLLHPVLSHEAARAFFVDKGAPLPSTLARPVALAGAQGSLLGRYRAGASEQDWSAARASMVTQGCFHNVATCMTFLSHWFRAEPESPAFRRLLGQAYDFWGAGIDESLLPYVARLFDESGTATLPAEVAYAEQVAKLFVNHYSHALPFDAGALHGPWRRCAMAGHPECRARIAAIEALGVDLPLDEQRQASRPAGASP